MDPLSLLGAAETIIIQANRIRETIDAAKTNARKCRALWERVQRLQQIAQELLCKQRMGTLLSGMMKNVMAVMDRAEETVKKFVKLKRAWRIVLAVHIKGEFAEINNALDSVLQDLMVAMSADLQLHVQNVRTNVKNAEAAAQDASMCAKEACDSLKRSMGFLEGRITEELSPLKFVQEMTNGIAETLRLRLPEHYINIDDRVKAVGHMLQQADTKVLAVVGMGGVGKTTLAKAVYNQACGMKYFDNVCWVTVGQQADLLQCQHQIWYHLVPSSQDQHFCDVEVLNAKICNIFERKCVLLVLDDVWTVTMLKKLMVAALNPQSKILVTTRDSKVAKGAHASIYSVELLNEKQSMELFCRWAFGAPSIPDHCKKYLGFVKEMSLQCAQLPLALCVIGSMVAGYTTMEEWKCAVKKLQLSRSLGKAFDDEILSILQNSYDDLDPVQQSFFFTLVGYPEDCHVKMSDLVEHWIARQDTSREDLSMDDWLVEGYAICWELIDRSLFMVDTSKCASKKESGSVSLDLASMSCYVHDMLREMGLHLAKKQNEDITQRERVLFPSMQQLQKRSILAKELSICGDIRGLWPQDLQAPHIEAFIARDWGLDILPLNLLSSRQLRVLDLACCSLERIPSEIEHLAALEVLRFDGCDRIKELPHEIVKLKRLTVLSLRNCRALEMLPNCLGGLTGLTSVYVGSQSLQSLPASIVDLSQLRKLELEHCVKLSLLPARLELLTQIRHLKICGTSSLTRIPDSVGSLHHLQTLVLSGCCSIVGLPDSVASLQQLQTLNLQFCVSLLEIPGKVGLLSQLQVLHLGACASLERIPESVGSLVQLQSLHLGECAGLTELPESLGLLGRLQFLHVGGSARIIQIPHSIGSLQQLRRLLLWGCSSLCRVPESLGQMRSLETLDMRGCSSLVQIPESLVSLSQLQNLLLGGCSSLAGLPEGVGSLTNLQTLELRGCSSFIAIPIGVGSLAKLRTLDMRGCSRVTQVPESMGALHELRVLRLRGCSGLMQIPESFGSLHNLEVLDLRGCSNLAQIPKTVGLLSKLRTLDLRDCSALVKIPHEIGSLGELEVLDLQGCFSLKHIPWTIGHLRALQTLMLRGCSNLMDLPTDMGSLGSLQTLVLQGCSNLLQIPESTGLLSQLQTLDLRGCLNLVGLPESIGSLGQLQSLNLRSCSSLTHIPDSVGSLCCLQTLDLGCCSRLVDIPECVGSLGQLRTLDLRSCDTLRKIPQTVGNKNTVVIIK